MKSKKSVIRFTCLSLIMIVIATCVSMSVSAVDSNDSAAIVYDPNSSIVHEVETLRTANSKQFLRSDGTYTMQMHSMFMIRELCMRQTEMEHLYPELIIII